MSLASSIEELFHLLRGRLGWWGGKSGMVICRHCGHSGGHSSGMGWGWIVCHYPPLSSWTTWWPTLFLQSNFACASTRPPAAHTVNLLLLVKHEWSVSLLNSLTYHIKWQAETKFHCISLSFPPPPTCLVGQLYCPKHRHAREGHMFHLQVTLMRFSKPSWPALIMLQKSMNSVSIFF